MAWEAICGKARSPLCGLGWKSLGVLELTEGSDMAEEADRALGPVDFALRVHLDREGFEDSTLSEIERWAAGIPAPTYAIDDETAVQVTDGTVEVVSEGHWKLLTPGPDAG
jgi:dipeptidase E